MSLEKALPTKAGTTTEKMFVDIIKLIHVIANVRRFVSDTPRQYKKNRGNN
jgi:hypothetical protein